MKQFIMGTEFYKAIQNASVDVVEAGVYEIKQRLYDSWTETTHESFDELLSACLHRMYRAKTESTQLENNITYYIGLLEGIVTVYSGLYAAEKEEKAIADTIKNSVNRVSDISYRILDVLNSNNNKWIGHSELAEKVNTTVQSLSNILRKMVSSGAVETTREGARIKYRLTRPGKKYFEGLCAKKQKKNSAISEEKLFEMLNFYEMLKQKIDEKPDEKLDSSNFNIINYPSISNRFENSSNKNVANFMWDYNKFVYGQNYIGNNAFKLNSKGSFVEVFFDDKIEGDIAQWERAPMFFNTRNKTIANWG